MVLRTKFPLILKNLIMSKEFVAKTSDMMKGSSLPRIRPAEFLHMHVNYPTGKLESTEQQIENLEKQLSVYNEQIAQADSQKAEIMRKYLE